MNAQPSEGTTAVVQPATGLSGVSSVMPVSGVGEVGLHLQSYAGAGSSLH